MDAQHHLAQMPAAADASSVAATATSHVSTAATPDSERGSAPIAAAVATRTPGRLRRGRANAEQMPLLDIDSHPEWFLDETTRHIGRDGVAQARAALRAARRRRDELEARDEHHDEASPTAA